MQGFGWSTSLIPVYLSMNVELETLRSLRLWRLHSPRQETRSVTVALVRPMAWGGAGNEWGGDGARFYFPVSSRKQCRLC